MKRIGIIGMGMMGRTHYEAYSKLKNAQVTAICDIDPKRAAGDLAGTAGNVIAGDLTQLPMDKIQGFTDYRDLIKLPDLDIVDVCVPTPLHAEMVVAALAANKHVISEKPLARTLEQAQQIVAAAARAKTFHMPAMCIRFWPEYAWLKEAVASNRYGKVRSATFTRRCSPLKNWFADGTQSGGAILDLHVHDVDFINYLFGKPKAVMTRGYKGYTGEPDHVLTQYLYDQVPLVTAEGGWSMADGFGFQMAYQVNFEHATADYQFPREKTLLLSQNNKQQHIQVANEAGYDAELRYFLNCIETKTRPTTVTAQDGLTALQIVTAESRSLTTNQIVPL